jgi:hypothetical protein
MRISRSCDWSLTRKFVPARAFNVGAVLRKERHFRFLDDGRLCMSSNAAECELRAVAGGKRQPGNNAGPRRERVYRSYLLEGDSRARLECKTHCENVLMKRVASEARSSN